MQTEWQILLHMLDNVRTYAYASTFPKYGRVQGVI